MTYLSLHYPPFSSMAKVTLVDLTDLWPAGRSQADLNKSSVPYYIGKYDRKTQGFPVLYPKALKGKPLQTLIRIHIPVGYRNALRYLNFKMACYWAVLTTACPNTWDATTKAGAEISQLHNSLSRNLVFHSRIREKFFKDVELNYYDGDSALKVKLKVTVTPFLRSPYMDTWLLREYQDLVHDPDALATAQPLKTTSDPVLFGESFPT
jgi:hypothetical protein